MRKSLKDKSGLVCVGRDSLVSEIMAAARKHGAVLLFGGRQAGKTTVLRKIVENYSSERGNVAKLTSLTVPVYVDLMRLPVEANPGTFFSFLTDLAVSHCEKKIDGFKFNKNDLSNLSHDPLARFVNDLRELDRTCGEVDIHIVFLLDEAKRVLTDRFPRGFQDNLFALLYGESELRPVPISLVFAGAQHLYKMSEDDTSPIGSRAAPVILRNLTEIDISLYFDNILGAETDNGLKALIYQNSGGYAGLSTRLIDELSDVSTVSVDFGEILRTVSSRNTGLLDNLIGSLTPEALCVANLLSKTQHLSLAEIAQNLTNEKLNRFAAPRVVDELCYSGIAIYSNKILLQVNKLFWEYFENSAQASAGDGSLHETWRLIEETELLLREVIWNKFTKEFDANALTTMRKILGDGSWQKILETQAKSKAQYKYSRTTGDRELMSCMYIGDLQNLILSNLSWTNFKPRFRDKRELEDIIKAIAPVRNDRAHFSVVPEKELERCRIACDDLMVLLEPLLEP